MLHFNLKKTHTIPGQNVDRLKFSRHSRVICAFGPKFIAIFDYKLNQIGKFLNEDKLEIIRAVEFIKIEPEKVQQIELKNNSNQNLENSKKSQTQAENLPDLNEDTPKSSSNGDISSGSDKICTGNNTKINLEVKHLLAVTGDPGLIKLINLHDPADQTYLKGHGSDVCDLMSHPIHKHLLFSASVDTSLRMWDLRTNRTVCIFGGLCGHEDMVICLDISDDGRWLVSGGSDNCIKLWDLSKYLNKIDNSGEIKYQKDSFSNKQPVIEKCHFPKFSSQVLHKTYINYVKFYGNIILSKNMNNRVSVFVFDGHLESNYEINLKITEKENVEKVEQKSNLKDEKTEQFIESTKITPNSEILSLKKLEKSLVYRNSINSNTTVLSDFKFNDKLIHAFALYKLFAILFDINGVCYSINLESFRLKKLSLRVEGVDDVIIIGDMMYISSNKNTITCYQIFS